MHMLYALRLLWPAPWIFESERFEKIRKTDERGEMLKGKA